MLNLLHIIVSMFVYDFSNIGSSLVKHLLIDCKCLGTFWTSISYVSKSCGVSKQVSSLHYLVIGYNFWSTIGLTFYLVILVLLFINLIFVVKEGKKQKSTYSIF